LAIPQVLAQETAAPVYLRQRPAVYFNTGANVSYPAGFYGGYFNAPWQAAGNWYERPYPVHFDVMRGRGTACPCFDAGMPVPGH
jgi:hypothetical protein